MTTGYVKKGLKYPSFTKAAKGFTKAVKGTGNLDAKVMTKKKLKKYEKYPSVMIKKKVDEIKRSKTITA